MNDDFSPAELAAFVPQNRLEELIVQTDATDNQDLEVAMYTAFMEADLGILVSTPSKPADLDAEFELTGEVRSAQISFPLDPDSMLWVFSNKARAQHYLDNLSVNELPPEGHKWGIVEAKGHDVVQEIMASPDSPLPIAGILINPFLPYCVALLREVLVPAAKMHRLGGDLRNIRHLGTELHLLPLPDSYQNLATALHHFCEQRPDVLAAYAGLVRVAPDKPYKPFVWYYTTQPRSLYTDSLQALGQRLYHRRDALLIQAVTSLSPPGTNTPADLAVHFSKSGIAPVYQRVS